MSDFNLTYEQNIRTELLDSSSASLESQVDTHHFAAGHMGRPGDNGLGFPHIVNCGGTSIVLPRDNSLPSALTN